MDDITFCLSDCQRKDCFRHPSNIQDRTIPHSYADFKETDTCPSRQLIEKMQLSKEDATKDATFDCISRQAALHYIADWQYGEANVGNETVYDNIEKFYKMIEQLPSVQPQRWIPVVEALPQDDENVIVTCLDDSGDTPFSYTTVAWHSKGMWVCDNERCPFVTAWMPLPEPWRGEETCTKNAK